MGSGCCRRVLPARLVVLAGLVLLPGLAGAGSDWETDYSNAVAQAKAEGKYLLLDFSGSDWCGWCIRLDKEVFTQREFKQYADENLVCVLVDSPRRKKLKTSLVEQNNALKSRYGIGGFPTVILLNPSEETVLKTGYRKGGPEPYVQHLQDAIASYEATHGELVPEKPAAEEATPASLGVRTVAPDATREVRSWTSITGAAVDAALYETKGVYAILRKADGSRLMIPIARLSSPDREYIDSLK